MRTLSLLEKRSNTGETLTKYKASLHSSSTENNSGAVLGHLLWCKQLLKKQQSLKSDAALILKNLLEILKKKKLFMTIFAKTHDGKSFEFRNSLLIQPF